MLGYYRRRSRDVEPLGECPLLTPALGALVRELAGQRSELLQGVRELSALEGDDGISIAMEVDAGTVRREELRAMLEGRGVRELSISADGRGHRPTAEGITIHAGSGLSLRASARAFFQGNAPLLDALVAEALDGIPERVARAWDLYAGVGLFAAALGRRARELHAVESDPQAAPLLAANLSRGARTFAGTELEFLRRQDVCPDLVVADPPRTGLPRQAREILGRLPIPHVVLVGCDPAAFAQDAGSLVRSGMRLTSLALLDLYPQSSHVEAVAHLVR